MAFRDKTARRANRAGSRTGPTFEQYWAGLHRYLMRRLHSAHHAQDLTQEAYLRLLRVEDTELVRKPQAYLYRIASNLAYEFKLREQKEPVTFDSDVLEHASEFPAEPVLDELGERLSTEQQLEQVLEQLPPAYRAVFLLRKRDGLSYPEIAKALRISVHTVKKYLARAVAQCRAADWTR